MVLRESAWGGLGSDLEKKSKKRKRGDVRKWTRAQLESVVQASEGELERGLRERNVVEIDGTFPVYSCTDHRSNVITPRQEAGTPTQPRSDIAHDPLEHNEGRYNITGGTNARRFSRT